MVDEPLAAAPAGVDADAWTAACAAVRAYCGWHIAPSVTEDVTVDGSGGSIQLLPTLHLTALTSITNDGTEVTDPEWSEAGMVRGSWTSKFRGVVANMAHGFDECPPELLPVLRAIVSGASLDGASSVTSGNHQVQFEQALNNSQHRATLDLYRMVTIA